MKRELFCIKINNLALLCKVTKKVQDAYLWRKIDVSYFLSNFLSKSPYEQIKTPLKVP